MANIRDLMSQNYLQNLNTGATYDLGAIQSSGPGLDYSSPVEISGMGKGYRLAGDPFTVVMPNGQRVRIGEDTQAARKYDMQNLEMQGKRQDIQKTDVETALKIAQLREAMGIDPSTGIGMQPSREQSAAAMGVPVAPPMYQGMSKKVRENLQSKEVLQAEKRLAEEEAAARGQGIIAQDAQRFKTLNESTDTGPIVGSAPVAWARGLFDDKVQEMRSIQDRLTPKMREPGSGATSDFDARMFQSALFGVNKNKGANEAIANAMILKAKAEKDRVSFNQAYLQANNTLQGADAAWNKYATDNPIFDPNSQSIPKINPTRQDWRTYFGSGQQSQRPPLESFKR